MRSDTCVMVAISLNIQQRVHPVIWTVTNLPFDCLKVFPIQKPIGGCLLASTNAIIYLNQSVPPYGVSLNSIADNSTAFPLSEYFFLIFPILHHPDRLLDNVLSGSSNVKGDPGRPPSTMFSLWLVGFHGSQV